MQLTSIYLLDSIYSPCGDGIRIPTLTTPDSYHGSCKSWLKELTMKDNSAAKRMRPTCVASMLNGPLFLFYEEVYVQLWTIKVVDDYQL